MVFKTFFPVVNLIFICWGQIGRSDAQSFIDADACQVRDEFYASQYKCGVLCNSAKDCLESERCLCDGKCGFSCQPTETLPVCSTLPYPDKGQVELDLPMHGDYGLQAVFSCDDGYELVGAEELTCMSTGNWSDPIPACVKTSDSVGCDKSELLYMDDFRFDESDIIGTAEIGAEIEFGCRDGYYLISSKSYMTCQADGMWSQVENACWKVSCGTPDIPEHGLLDTYDFTYSSAVNVRCESGYELVPSPFISHCQADRSWSDQHAHVCQAAECPEIDIQSMALNTVGPISVTFGSRISFTCAMDYQLIGADTIVCLSDGTWTDKLPICQEIVCGEPEKGFGVIMTGTSDTYTVGDVVQFTCESDAMLMVGSDTRQCNLDGTWSGTTKVTSCVYSCDALPLPEDQEHTIVGMKQGYGFVEEVEYRCKADYTLVGHGLIKCDVTTGQWQSTDVPNCIFDSSGSSTYEVKTRPPSIEGRVLTVNQWDSVALDCFIPASERWKGDSKWFRSGQSSRPTQFPIGRSRSWYRAILTRIQLEDQGEYRCGIFEVPQVEPTEYSKITIQVLPKCPDPRLKVDGHVKVNPNVFFDIDESVMFVCKSGYRLSGDLIKTCQADGSWAGQLPMCNKLCTGDGLPDPDNGYGSCVYHSEFRATQTFYCQYGFRLSDTSLDTVECIDGIWTGVIPQCIPILCPTLTPSLFGEVSDVENGGTSDGTYTVGTKVTFGCDQNYAMYGTDKCVCQQNGQWDSEPPQCLPASDIEVKLGSRSVRNGDVIPIYKGRDIFLDCKVISNDISVVSSADLRWYRIHENGERVGGSFEQYALFSEESTLRFAIPSVSSYHSGRYQCGTDTIAFEVIIQVLKECPDLVFPENGVIIGMDTKVGTHIRYQCSERYQLIGSEERVCQYNGIWTESAPICQVYSCGEVTFPENGYHTGNSRHEGLVGQSLEFTCDLGYDLIGQSLLHCQMNGFWSSEPPTCESKCNFVNCGEGQYCQLSGADAVCLCLNPSQCPTDDGPVCGQDAITYQSQCHLAVEECERETTIRKAHDGVCTRAGLCQLKPVPHHGTCNAVYYWDDKEYKCKHVQEDECVPGEYGFPSLVECNRDCSNACTKTIVRGPCSGSVEKWAYNVSANTCTKFVYSGCGGNENNFNTRDDCMIKCPGKTSCKPCESTMDLVTACRLAQYAIKAKVENILEYSTGTQFNITIEKVLRGDLCEHHCWMTSTLEYHIDPCQCPHIRQLDASYLMVITQFNHALPMIDKGTFVRIWDDKLQADLQSNRDCQRRFSLSDGTVAASCPEQSSDYCQLLSPRSLYLCT